MTQIIKPDSKKEPRPTIDEIADAAGKEGLNLNAFTLKVVAAGYNQEEFDVWLMTARTTKEEE